MNGSELVLEIVGKGNVLPPYSAKGCIQTLTPLPQGRLCRTISGDLIYVGLENPPKFQSVINCEDKAPPAFEGIWPGDLLKVGCLQPITLPVPSGERTVCLSRDPFGPLHLYDTNAKEHDIISIEGREVTVPQTFPKGFITYKPWLDMTIKSYKLKTDEWGLTVGWSLELEEL